MTSKSRLLAVSGVVIVAALRIHAASLAKSTRRISRKDFLTRSSALT
ncbi:hypothetical protein [Paraburkholderia sp. GAS334]|jgi:hypothetical protein